MAATFFGLNIALQGLYTSRAGLDVTNHNIVSSGNRGYSRQVIQQRATAAIPLGTGRGMLGTGSEVYGIKQIRDTFLDRKYWNSNGTLGEYAAKNSISSQIEDIFDATSSTNFNSIFNKFDEALQDLSTYPDDTSHRTSMKQSALTFAEYFNNASEKLQDYQQDLNFNIKSTVDQINSFANQIQSLNRQIYSSESDGNMANDLRDQRAVLVDDLSQLINVKVSESDDGKFRVSVNGKSLVDHFTSSGFEVKQREILNKDGFLNNKSLNSKYGLADTSTDADKTNAFNAYVKDCENYKNTNTEGLYDVYWKGTDTSLDTSDYALKGVLKGYIDMRDGNSNTISSGVSELDKNVNYKGIPYYMNQLNKFVQTFAKLMNEGKSFNDTQLAQKGGFANGYNLNGTTGLGLFSSKNPDGTYNTGNIDAAKGNTIDYSKITAANFSISAEVESDVKNIATTYDANAEKGNNDLVKAILDLKDNNGAFSQGTILDYMTGVTSELAIDTKQAETFQKNQENITIAIENQRLSVSGVNPNEEMVNMLKYQQIYTLASKMIATMDDILNTTINKLCAS